MSATFWVTANCNLGCKYCYEGEDKPSNVMSKDVIDKAINFIINKYEKVEDNLVIRIHGGEPLLEFKSIKYIVESFKKKSKNLKIRFAITTNGTILNDEMLEFIKNEIVDVTVSIDGDIDTHNNMRPFKNGKGSHSIVMKNSQILNENIKSLRVRMTFDSDTVFNLYNDVKYLIESGFRCIVPAPNLFDKNWDLDHVNALEAEMYKIKEYLSDKKNIFVSIVDKPDYISKGNCSGGINNFHIYTDGNIYPCIVSVGNKEFSIGNIVNGINKNNLKKILSYSTKVNPECEGCSLVNYCDGSRCKIVNKIITNNYEIPSSMHCALENLRYKVSK